MSESEEIVRLAEEILRNIELQEIPLSNIVLRCARLARLSGNQSAMNLFKYELSGYPKDQNGYVTAEAFGLARYANRAYFKKDKNGKSQEYMFSQTVAELENELEAAKEQMKVAFDKDVSVSSANPRQYVMPQLGNTFERNNLRKEIAESSKKVNQLKSAYYNYVLGVHYEMKLKNITEDIFKKRKLIVDKALSTHLPDTLEKFVLVYEKLKSDKEEDWSNALTSCRRALKDVADLLYPATDEEIDISDGKTMKLTDDKFIARLKQFIKHNQESDTFKSVVGSNLEFIADRLDSVRDATCKGTHAKVAQEEAESYVMYTYMLLGDLLKLYKPVS